MQHSILDRIYLSFLLILLASFTVLIIYTSRATRTSMMSEKSETLMNEAKLIASQTVAGYLTGVYTEEELTDYFNYYATELNADIWYTDKDGNIVAYSKSDRYKRLPASIYSLDPEYRLDSSFTTFGKFYDIYSDNMISINVPVHLASFTETGDTKQENTGALIIHTSSAQINNLVKNIFGIIYLPCLIIIIIAFAFLGTISRKVIQPVKRLSAVAHEYSKGNFDVKTDIESKDELGTLAQSMESMASDLSRLEEYRRDFISNISHDFRSPLTSIKGYIEAMLDGTIPEDMQGRYLNIVLNETKRLTKLTSGLLDMNNLETYGPYLKLSDFDIIDVIKSTINTFEIKCIDKNIAIYMNNHAINTVVTADKTKIQQVIYNLIDNAIKFTPSGKKIFVTIKEKNEKVFVSVKDEGIGMDDETQKQIWTRFFKGDPSRGKDKQGTGLGLAITKEIIKAHNENIDVVSTESAGSEFTFSLTKKQETTKEEG